MNEKKPAIDDDALMPDDIQRFAEALAPIAPPAALRARILRRIRGTLDLTKLNSIRPSDGHWITLAPGVEMKVLFVDGDTGDESLLLRLAPGAALPPHLHPGHEECLVLQGEVRTQDITLTAGDYHFAPSGVPHDTIVSHTGALLFLRQSMGPARNETRRP